MLISIPSDKGCIDIDTDISYDLSIPLLFSGPQPNAYGVEPAASKPVETGLMIGDTRRGGSVNFEQYTIIPHCTGTHTECVGHITHERISIRDCLRDMFNRSLLISIEPVTASNTDETYSRPFGGHDLLITRDILQSAVKSSTASKRLKRPIETPNGVPTALIVRTLPNDASKLTRHYDDIIPPFFSTEAVKFIVECGFTHLLVDVPSIDRLFDDGKLTNHRIFWNVEPESFETNANTRINSTITEFIYVPANIADGEYLLNLQIAPFESDVSPSRPILFEIDLPQNTILATNGITQSGG